MGDAEIKTWQTHPKKCTIQKKILKDHVPIIPYHYHTHYHASKVLNTFNVPKENRKVTTPKTAVEFLPIYQISIFCIDCDFPQNLKNHNPMARILPRNSSTIQKIENLHPKKNHCIFPQIIKTLIFGVHSA